MAAVVAACLLAGAVVALAMPAAGHAGSARAATRGLPPWAGISLPARRVGPAILVGPRPLIRRPAISPRRAPVITRAPRDAAVAPGRRASFTVTASGTPPPSVQWQRSIDGGRTWTAIPGAHGVTYTLTARPAETGDRFRAVFRNPEGTAITHPATLRVTRMASAASTHRRRPRITSQPKSQLVHTGARASFKAAASGRPRPGVRWQVSTHRGGTWTTIKGAKSRTYSFTARLSESGRRYRAVFTNTAGKATTSPATLTVTIPGTKPAITTQPSSQTVLGRAPVSFTAAASGKPAPTAQWQVSSNRGKSWSNLAGATADTLSLTATNQELYEYRAVFTNAVGHTASRPAILTIAGSSTNWSGYVATGKGFRSVSSSWTVPTVTCPSSDSGTITYSSQWIGIDGYGNNTVEQDGTEADCVYGSPYYGAWYEMYGDNAVDNGYEVPLSVSSYPVYPGDAMTASVTVTGSVWTLAISDATEHWSYSVPITWSGVAGQASVEWIAERPTLQNGLAILPDFGTVTFSGAGATDSARSGSISAFAFAPLEMISSQTSPIPLAAPGPLNAAGQAFSVKWLGSS